ncbi:hypothetical protein VNO78_34204 [Psophocarpus tetragonolobus]|uniref:Uncharacterized protein n=1 Tax=Psophocarpus tetragonolobus TaxID=3891 RepID=A0AAN9P0H4_PSOTE
MIRFSGLLTTSRAANRPRRRNPNTSPDHSIGRSDGRCVQRAGTLRSRSLTELTRQIAPPTKNGHAPPPIESRKSSQSVNPYYVWTCLATILPPEPKDFDFASGVLKATSADPWSASFMVETRTLFVFHKSKNFTSDYEIRMPPTVPVNHYSDPEGQHNRIRILCTGGTTRPVKARSASPAEGTSQPVHTRGGPIDPTQAVSQAPSPESNPNSPSPVTTMVGHYPTIES